MRHLIDLAIAIAAALGTLWWVRQVLRDHADPNITAENLREPWESDDRR